MTRGRGFPSCGSDDEEPPAVQETWVKSWVGKSLERKWQPHSYILLESPWTEAWWVTVRGSQRSQTLLGGGK